MSAEAALAMNGHLATLEQHLDSTASELNAYKRALSEHETRSLEAFAGGASADQLVRDRVALVDTLLIRLWQTHIPAELEMSLIAVGGYGRGELFPGSDIDLLILWRDENEPGAREGLETLLTFLWDIGLEVGHSVRTLEQCIEEAAKDVTTVTNLIESRRLCGSEKLYEQMTESAGPDTVWPCHLFFEAKIREQKNRHLRYDNSISTLEPNVKESPGGLRDIHTIGWVAKRYFGASNLEELVDHNFLTPKELDKLTSAQSNLWKIRFALHALTGRHEDKLLFEHQRALSAQFNYVDNERSLGVEQFMQSYYKTAILVDRLNEMLLQHFEEAILSIDRETEVIAISGQFQAVNGFLEAIEPTLFEQDPLALLRIFLVLQQHPELKGVRASTIRLINDNRHRIDDGFRDNPDARQLFMDIMRQPRGITHELRRMNRYGILASYLPNFANIVGRMQYDLFHQYTVDEHTLFVVRNLRRFAVEEFADEFPLCSELIKTLDKPELLYLAGMFHDIAKGRGGDHSTLGEADAIAFGKRHDMPEEDYMLVAWLVREHLNMSMTAQRKDITDPDVIHEFAQKVGDTRHLDYLYLLTVADSRATNPKRWNAWKDALLKTLYNSTKKALQTKQDKPDPVREIAETHRGAITILENEGIDTGRILALWMNLTEDYFQYSDTDEIAWHTREILSNPDSNVIAIRWIEEKGVSEILQYVKDFDGLFAQTVIALDQLGLSVVSARLLVTDDSYILNSYSVLDEDGSLNAFTRSEVIERLLGVTPESRDHVDHVSQRVPRQLKQFDCTTSLKFSTSEDNAYTTMQLISGDRPAVLAKVGMAFNECNIRVHGARIATLGAEIEDYFTITSRSGEALYETSAELECLKTTLLDLLSDNGD